MFMQKTRQKDRHYQTDPLKRSQTCEHIFVKLYKNATGIGLVQQTMRQITLSLLKWSTKKISMRVCFPPSPSHFTPSLFFDLDLGRRYEKITQAQLCPKHTLGDCSIIGNPVCYAKFFQIFSSWVIRKCNLTLLTFRSMKPYNIPKPNTTSTDQFQSKISDE
jgi:hypothetical protein